jgi:hypothetical protein
MGEHVFIITLMLVNMFVFDVVMLVNFAYLKIIVTNKLGPIKFQVYSLHSRDGGGVFPILSFANRCQFHQHFMSSFCAKIILPKKYIPNF